MVHRIGLLMLVLHGMIDIGHGFSIARKSPPIKMVDADDEIAAKAASKFKVITCLSSACTKKRAQCGLDPLSTFGSFYECSKNSEVAPGMVEVEEGPCLGSCKFAPCVGIEHEEFNGNVALEGMTEEEFSNRA